MSLIIGINNSNVIDCPTICMQQAIGIVDNCHFTVFHRDSLILTNCLVSKVAYYSYYTGWHRNRSDFGTYSTPSKDEKGHIDIGPKTLPFRDKNTFYLWRSIVGMFEAYLKKLLEMISFCNNTHFALTFQRLSKTFKKSWCIPNCHIRQ